MTFDPNQGRDTPVDTSGLTGATQHQQQQQHQQHQQQGDVPETTPWQHLGVPQMDVFLGLLRRQLGYDKMDDAQKHRFWRRVKIGLGVVFGYFLLAALASGGGLKGLIYVVFAAAILVGAWFYPRMIRRDRERRVARILREQQRKR